MSTPAKATNRAFLQLLDEAMKKGSSDLHIQAGTPPMIRLDGELTPLQEEILTAEYCDELLGDFLGQVRRESLVETKREQDFSFGYEDVRIRANVFLQRGSMAASLRLLPGVIRTMEELGLPEVASRMIEQNQGLIIVAGPTGHGKSTTLAAMVDSLSSRRKARIITIEDPIEYVFKNKKSVITQREVGGDTQSFAHALRAAYREDPDIVLVGEMRDLETMEAALQIAETGHLVLTTLHTNSAAQTANRIIDVFPPHQQDQIRVILAEVLVGIFSQRLLPKLSGGRVLAAEVLLATPAVRSLIREGKTHQLPNLISTSVADGMISLDKRLAELISKGEISLEEGLAWSLDPRTLRTMIY